MSPCHPTLHAEYSDLLWITHSKKNERKIFMTDPLLVTNEITRFESVASVLNSFVSRDFNDNELCCYLLAAEARCVFVNRNS